MVSLMFHVRHNARPGLVGEVLDILIDHGGLTLDDILVLGAARGYQVGTAMQSKQSLKENPIQVARDLGLIELDRLTLTSTGRGAARLRQYKPGV